MAAKDKTPAQIRAAKIRQLKKALDTGAITVKEYNEGVREAAIKAAGQQAGPKAAVMARGKIASATKAASAGKGAAAAAAAAAAKGAAKKGVMRGVLNIAKGAAKNPYLYAATVVGPPVARKLQEIGQGMQSQAKKPVPTSSVAKAEKALGQRMGNKTVAPKPTASRRRADSGDSARTPKPLTKAQQNASMGRTGAVHTVKKGDTLWDIAQANKTTVSALLKANPTIAKRKEAGKVTIYSGSKVRIPGKK